MRRIALLALMLSLFISGCAAAGGPPPEPTPTPSPREIAASVGRATQAAQSVHFTITLSGKPVFADQTGVTILNSVEGDLRRPDAVLAILNVTLGGAVAELRTISLEGKQFITNPITRQWQCLAPGNAFDPVILFEPQSGVEALLQDGFSEITLVGVEQIDGRAQYHLRGSIPGDRLQAISMNLLGAGDVAVELWADQETLLASRLILTDTAVDPANPSVWTVTFSEYGKTIDVREPVTC